ncbi:MAG: polysaccharide biosynthesis/export family protein [Planctomycetes bacterium]|nr:polysaccharide biosynthesis/export family protein [Planctomycetota bacterium]
MLQRHGWRQATVAARFSWLLPCLGVIWPLGCAKEHRISLAQFLAQQQSAPAPAEPGTPESAAAAAANLERYIGPYRVGTGDVLLVTLTRADQTGLFPPVQVRVDRNGEIDLPIVGAVKVRDMELEDIDDRIRAAYVPAVLTEGVVHVTLVTPEPTNVLVVGAVTAPGLVQLRHTERNLLYALVGAGGVSSMASGQATVRRIRKPDAAEAYRLTDPLELRTALAAEPLENGDIVYVHAAQPNTVFVGGLVLRSAPQVYPPGTNVTVLQALAAAGGLRTDVTPTQGTLIRRLSDGQDVHVKLNLNRLAMGRDPNISLQAGDILWVPETLGTTIQDFINRNLYLRAGASVNYNVRGIEFLNRQDQQGGGGSGSGNLQDAFDPFGFLNQNSLLQGISSRP